MWRIVYERSPKGGRYEGAGPWHRTRAEAELWLDFLLPYYPEAHLQSWQAAYPRLAALN